MSRSRVVYAMSRDNKPVLNGTPGAHGGNLDCKEITSGSSVYLPVSVKGGLLSLGDLHALMGDGEVCICGAEVSGTVTVRTGLMDTFLPTPCVETEDAIHFIAEGRTLDECQGKVLRKAHVFLTKILQVKPNEAARIMSLLGDLKVCQVVNPLKTMRFSLPRSFVRTLHPGTW